MNFEELGNKICIIGCSSSGKSTLANSLSKKLELPVYHLDFFAHYPNTEWELRPTQELIEQQQILLKNDSWIIEGNYSVCMPERFAKATSIIWLDANVCSAAVRYIKRSIKNDPHRTGRLPGVHVEFRWFLLKHILFNYPKNRIKYHNLIAEYHLPVIYMKRMSELNKYYKMWGLKRD